MLCSFSPSRAGLCGCCFWNYTRDILCVHTQPLSHPPTSFLLEPPASFSNVLFSKRSFFVTFRLPRVPRRLAEGTRRGEAMGPICRSATRATMSRRLSAICTRMTTTSGIHDASVISPPTANPSQSFPRSTPVPNPPRHLYLRRTIRAK